MSIFKISEIYSRTFSNKIDSCRVYLYFAGIVLFFYIDKIILGPFAFVRLHDVFDSDYSRYKILGELFYNHGFFSWYPHYLGGLPAYAWHHTPFYILCLVSLAIPLWFIYSFLCCTWMFLAGLGLYRLFDEYLDIPRGFSLIAGLLYSVVVQIQPNNIPQVVFNYGFPIFLVWFLDLFKNIPFKKKIVPLVGCNFLLLISYPVLTLPYYPLLHIAMILFFISPNKLPERRNSLLVKSCIVWFGYILMNLPVLYSLWDYVPLAVKKVNHVVSSQLNGIEIFGDFATQSLNVFSSVTANTIMLIPFIGGIAFSLRSKFLRNLYIVWFAVFFITAFFTSRISKVLKDSIFLKMDLSHFSWILPFLSMIIIAVSINIIIQKKGLLSAYKVFLAISFLILCCFMFFLNLPANLFIANIYVLVIILLFLSYISNQKNMDIPQNAVHTMIPKMLLPYMAISLTAQLALLFTFFKLRAYMLINLAAFVFILVLATVYLLRYQKNKRNEMKSLWPRFFITATIISLMIFFVFEIRIIRFNGMEPEKFSYKLIESYPVLDEIKKKETGIYRAGMVGGIPPVVLTNYGFESIDGRGPISNKYFKDYFKLIVKPQLAEKKDEYFFDSYWYNLFLTCGSGNQNFNYPLLYLTNVKYLISSDYIPNLVEKSDFLRKEKRYLKNMFYDIFNPPFTGHDNMLNVHVYRLKETFERWYLATNPVLAENDNQALSLLLSQTVDNLKNNVIYSNHDIEKGFFDGFVKQNNSYNKIELSSYSPDRIVLNVTSNNPAIMVITNNYDKRWTAYVDGVKTKIIRANHAFQSFLLDKAGFHKVDIRFEDKLLWMLHYVMIFGFFIINGILLFKKPVAYSKIK